MRKFLIYIIKAIREFKRRLFLPVDYLFMKFSFYVNGVKFANFKTYGRAKLFLSLGSTLSIGNDFTMNNRLSSNPIGRFSPCTFVVGKDAKLTIGRNTGISSTTIVCHNKIDIGDNVKIGGNVVIYDTDFHSLNSTHRLTTKSDQENTKTTPVIIGNNVFIGAHSTILKGVTIGDNVIIGACSVVTKDIPANQVWGNPSIRYINSLNLKEKLN